MTITTQRINGLDLAYLGEGETGPLALLLHGFPETPHTFRRLAPRLAAAGYRVVAPFMRSFAPSEVPSDGDMTLPRLVEDANAWHEAMDGDGDAVIVGHDWGGFTTWGAALAAPERWSKVVVLDVPPLEYYARKGADPALIQKNNHFYFFQMALADHVVPVDDFAYLDALWEHWIGSGSGELIVPDREAGKKALSSPQRVTAALDLYRQNFPAATFGTPAWEMGAVLDGLPTQPTLYLHGGEDPVMDADSILDLRGRLPEGSDAVLLPGVGHFPLAEAPDEVVPRIAEFLTLDGTLRGVA